MALVLAYVRLLAQMVVKENVKVVKVVVKTDARQHVEVDVAKDAKGVVMPCVKAIV